MRPNLVLPLALALCAALAAPADAGASRTFTATDPGGDANGANSQGVEELPVPSTPTPGSYAPADLRRLTFAVGKRRTVVVTVELAAAPDPQTGLEIRFDSGCDFYGTIMLSNYLDQGAFGYVNGCNEAEPVPVDVIGTTVRWTIPVKDFHLDPGRSLSDLRVYSHAGTGAAKLYGFPFVWDELITDGYFELP